MDKFLSFAVNIAEQAGKKLSPFFNKTDVSLRGGSLKTTYDFLADALIKQGIEKTFPAHSYLTEETGLVDKRSDYLWIIDPLDGTGNFVNRNPFFAVSVALWFKGKPIVAVMEAPYLQERFIALNNQGAWSINLKSKVKAKAQVSAIAKLDSSYILFCEGGEKNKRRVSDVFDVIYPQTREMRKIGSAVIECAWVGTGRADAYWTIKTNLWDIGAGALFVKEAGGKLLHFNGEPFRWSDFILGKQYNIIFTNGKIKLPKIKF